MNADFADSLVIAQILGFPKSVIFNSEIGKMNNVANGCFNDNAGSVGNSVVNAKKFSGKIIADSYDTAIVHLTNF